MHMNHNGAAKNTGLLLGLVVAGLIIWAVTKAPPAAIPPPSQPPPGGTPPSAPTCDPLVTPRLTVNCFDVELGVPITTLNSSYRKVGATQWNFWNCGQQIATDLECGSEYEFLPGGNYTADQQNNGMDGDYAPYFKLTVPNKETFTHDIKVMQHEDEAGITFRFLDSLGDNAPQAIGTSGSERISAGFRAAPDQVWGNPYIASAGLTSCNGGNRADRPNTLCLYVNGTDVTPIEKMFVGSEEMAAVTTPGWKIANEGFGGNASQSDTEWYCFEAPIIKEAWTNFDFTVTAETGANPTNRTHGSLSSGTSVGVSLNTKYANSATDGVINDSVANIAVLYAGHLYIDEETNNIGCGVVDDDKNTTGTNIPAIFPLSWT